MGGLNVEVGPKARGTGTPKPVAFAPEAKGDNERSLLRGALYAVAALSLVSVLALPVLGAFADAKADGDAGKIAAAGADRADHARTAWIALAASLAGLAASVPRR